VVLPWSLSPFPRYYWVKATHKDTLWTINRRTSAASIMRLMRSSIRSSLSLMMSTSRRLRLLFCISSFFRCNIRSKSDTKSLQQQNIDITVWQLCLVWHKYHVSFPGALSRLEIKTTFSSYHSNETCCRNSAVYETMPDTVISSYSCYQNWN